MSAATTVPTPADQSRRSGRLLGLLRRLIDYGKELVTTLKEQHNSTDLGPITRAFGISDLRVILARVVRGLFRANRLEHRIIGCAKRLDAERKPRATPASRASRSAAPRVPRPAEPTPEEIAEAVRRQPIGVILADICRDLGITRGHKLWEELRQAITEYGGSFIALFNDTMDRVLGPLPKLGRAIASQAPPLPAAAATGPPS